MCSTVYYTTLQVYQVLHGVVYTLYTDSCVNRVYAYDNTWLSPDRTVKHCAFIMCFSFYVQFVHACSGLSGYRPLLQYCVTVTNYCVIIVLLSLANK